MADILSVEVGDRFESPGHTTTLEVVKIWFEFSLADQRWETSVSCDVNHVDGSSQLSGKACDFVKTLHESSFVRVDKSLSNGKTTASTPTVATLSVDIKRKKREDDFRLNAVSYGLSPFDLGRKVCLFGNRYRTYTIVGANPRNYKLPIIVKGNRGGIYKITVEKAKAGLV